MSFSPRAHSAIDASKDSTSCDRSRGPTAGVLSRGWAAAPRPRLAWSIALPTRAGPHGGADRRHAVHWLDHGSVVSGGDQGEAERRSWAIRRRAPPPVRRWDQPGEVLPHGPVVLGQGVHPEAA